MMGGKNIPDMNTEATLKSTGCNVRAEIILPKLKHKVKENRKR